MGRSPLEPKDPAAAESVGFSSERLQKLEDWISGLVRDKRLPHAAAIVAKENAVVFARSTDATALDISMRRARVFGLVHPILTVCLMTFYEEGRFALDDAVSKHLPEFRPTVVLLEPATSGEGALRTVKCDSPVTIRHLLTHTSGLSHGWDASGRVVPVDPLYLRAGLAEPDANTLEGFTRKLGKLPLLFQPGTEWHYSTGYDVVARLIEVLAGNGRESRPVDRVLRERVFEPLDMSRTSFDVVDERDDSIAPLWMPASSRASMLHNPTHRASRHLRGLVRLENSAHTHMLVRGSGGPAGELVTTPHDLYKFLDAVVLRGGVSPVTGRRVLAPRTVELMRTNQLRGGADLLSFARVKLSEVPLRAQGVTLGLGSVTLEPAAQDHLTPGTIQWGSSSLCHFFVDPGERLVAVFFSSCVFVDRNELDARGAFASLVYQALVHQSRQPVPLSSRF